MQRSRRILLSLSLLTLFCFAPAAQADPIVVTSGQINFYRYTSSANTNTFSLEGPGVSIHGNTSTFHLAWTMADLDNPNTNRAQLGRPFIDDDVLFIKGPFTIGGITYSQYYSDEDGFWMSLTADTFDFPTDPSVDSVTFSSTFTMNGHLGLRPYLHPDAGIYDFTGQGIVTAVYSRFQTAPRLWFLQSLTYTLQAAPVPEPATLLLFGTGIAGAAAKVYRRRKRRKQE